MVSYLLVHEWMAQSNLLIQALVVVLIVFAVAIERKRMFVWHGNLMLIAVIIPALLLIMHMGPTFVKVVQEGIGEPNWVAFLGVAHGILGVAALAFGGWLTVRWVHFGTETSFCVTKKRMMWEILAFWGFALGLGYLYYVAHLVWT